MPCLVTGWTENTTIRNKRVEVDRRRRQPAAAAVPVPAGHASTRTTGPEFINHDVANWLQAKDITQTRSRPYRKNDQATVESKNNHIVRKHAFHWRYDTPAERTLLNELWQLVSLRLNFIYPDEETNRIRHKPIDTPHTTPRHASHPLGNAYSPPDSSPTNKQPRHKPASRA